MPYEKGDVVRRNKEIWKSDLDRRFRVSKVDGSWVFIKAIDKDGKPVMVDDMWNPGQMVEDREVPYLRTELELISKGE